MSISLERKELTFALFNKFIQDCKIIKMDKTNKALIALRNRSESEALETKNKLAASERSLPRGEYYAHIMGPKLNKSSYKIEAVKHIKVSGDNGGEDNCMGMIVHIFSLNRGNHFRF